MHILIVYTHPNHESLNYSFLQSTLQGLKKNNQAPTIEVLDLYAEHFDPILRFDQDNRRRDMYKVPELEKYRNQITKADLLVFIYPIWWGRCPAMLEGYIDRLFATGFGYAHANNIMGSVGLLTGKQVICISTMKGPTHYPFFFLNNAHKALMKKALFNFVGIKKVKFFEFGGMESKKGKQAEKLAFIENYFATL